ncbi:hypothetical protein GH733_016037 [Mirounga leonina]|nr:hypothetical protein GH733_016037 [Mirounga leonina]
MSKPPPKPVKPDGSVVILDMRFGRVSCMCCRRKFESFCFLNGEELSFKGKLKCSELFTHLNLELDGSLRAGDSSLPLALSGFAVSPVVPRAEHLRGLHVVTPADSGTAENTPSSEAGNLSWLRECLDNRVGVNGLDKAGSTALYWACHGGHKDIVEMLFTQPNIELNQQNKLGDTALHAAAWKGYADIVQLLLEKGARTDLRNNEKKLALDMATNAACASLLKKKQGTDAVRTLSNAEEYLDDEDSD